MSERNDKKMKFIIKEYGPIGEFLSDYLSKLIPKYEEKIAFSGYGIFSALEEVIIQLEIALGMDDGRYRNKIPTLVEALKIYIRILLGLIEQKKLGYIA